MEPQSKDVSFLGSLLKINSVGKSHLQSHPPIRQHSGWFAHQKLLDPKQSKADKSGQVGDSDPDDLPTEVRAPSTTSCGFDNVETVESKSEQDTDTAINFSDSPRISKSESNKVKDREEKERLFKRHHSVKKGMAKKSTSSSESTTVDVTRHDKLTLPKPKAVRNPPHCACRLLAEPELELSPINHTNKTVSNLYYARPPPTLVEYRNRELAHPMFSCWDQITDELIDLTQSTISIVESLKSEHRH